MEVLISEYLRLSGRGHWISAPGGKASGGLGGIRREALEPKWKELSALVHGRNALRTQRIGTGGGL